MLLIAVANGPYYNIKYNLAQFNKFFICTFNSEFYIKTAFQLKLRIAKFAKFADCYLIKKLNTECTAEQHKHLKMKSRIESWKKSRSMLKKN